ncbi:MAG TPA: glycosyltransferase family 39 protein, partial [Candidatus Thermoplasmatota archaeon]|nr:glycosyltransferase family 39 protein [Candidatus Thermoplasmatota archaeon]
MAETRLARTLDAAERRLARAGAALARPAGMRAAVVALIVAALLLRLPLVFTANDVPAGHNDANIYFNQAHAEFLKGNFYPDAHRGTGWQLLLYVVLDAYGFAAGPWVGKYETLTGETAQAALVAYALSAMLTVGIVAATYLLARRVLPPLPTLGAVALVAVDPYLMFISTSAMSEPPYTALLVLALACVLKARDHPAWLVGTGVLMALAHVLRINGLVMFGATLLFAAILLARPGRGWRRRAPWGWFAASVAAFLLVSAPYLAWRADQLPGPFD